MDDLMKELCEAIINELKSDELIYSNGDIDDIDNGFECIGYSLFRMGRSGGFEPKFMQKHISDDEQNMFLKYFEENGSAFDHDINSEDEFLSGRASEFEEGWHNEDGGDFLTSNYSYTVKVTSEGDKVVAQITVDNWKAPEAKIIIENINQTDFDKLSHDIVYKIVT